MKEIRVYVIDLNDETDLQFRKLERAKEYDRIKDEAERLGSVYSLKGFQEAINNETLDLTSSFILID